VHQGPQAPPDASPALLRFTHSCWSTDVLVHGSHNFASASKGNEGWDEAVFLIKARLKTLTATTLGMRDRGIGPLGCRQACGALHARCMY